MNQIQSQGDPQVASVISSTLPCTGELGIHMKICFLMHFFFPSKLAWLFSLNEWTSYTTEQLNQCIAYTCTY